MSAVAFWICSHIGIGCEAAPKPNVTAIQSAYEREAASSSPLHDRGLRVLNSSCDDPKDGRYLCQITFLSKSDPTERLYFTVIAVARNGGGWKLKSGLCKP
ncbi:MAG: hypothetical protein ACREQD_12155 [Candidatus Binataceae bacterium]